jgi:hypothetical protein
MFSPSLFLELILEGLGVALTKTIPILTPAFLKSVVKLDKAAGKRPWRAAEKQPKTIDHPYKASRVSTAIIEYIVAEEIAETGINIFRGPVNRSA